MTPPPRRPSLFGPLVWWELAKLARRGHATRARIILLYSLLLALITFAFYWSFPASPYRLFRGTAGTLTIAQSSSLAESLALVLFETQILLVAVLTPASAASALAEEKERHTLPLLLATELTDREIVWGKAAGRALFMLLTVLAGAPVIMVTLLAGGVDGRFLTAGYALTAGTAILSAAIGVSAACHSPDTRSALVRAYGQSAILIGGLLLPPFVLLSPFAMLIYTRLDYSEALRVACGFAYPVGQAAVAWLILSEAARQLRNEGATAGPPDPTEYPEPPRGRPSPIILGPLPPASIPLPPLDEASPVLWKERHTGRTLPLPVLDAPIRWIGALFTIIAIMLFLTGGWSLVKRAIRGLDPIEAERLAQRGPEPPDEGGSLLTTAGVFAAGLYLVPLAAGLAGIVAGERHRRTLDPLRATLLGRRSILHAKVRAHAERGLALGVGAVAAIGGGFGADGGAPLGLAAMGALAAGFALVIALAAWLSVRCATPIRAFRLCLLPVVLVIALPLLVRNSIDWNAREVPLRILAGSAAGCALAAALFWWRAGARFERGE